MVLLEFSFHFLLRSPLLAFRFVLPEKKKQLADDRCLFSFFKAQINSLSVRISFRVVFLLLDGQTNVMSRAPQFSSS